MERSAAHRFALLGVVAAVAVAFLVAVSPWAGEDFGYSLDGFNGAVWGLGARALAEDPGASRMGGVQPDGDRYANHPPLTVWTAGAASAVSGDRPWAVRGPAVLAGLLVLGALALVLVDAGVGRFAAGAGVVAVGSTAMFLTYGAMLDTPMVGLPFGLLAIAVAQRGWQGRPPPGPVVVAAGALAALSGWQAALTAVLAAGVALVGRGEGTRRTALTLAAGVGAGVAVTVAWVGWVHDGSLAPLFDQAGVRSRSTGSEAPWLEVMGDQLTDLYGPPLLLVALAVAVVVALVVPSRRPASGADRGDGVGGGDRVGSGDGVGGGDGPGSWWRPTGIRPVVAILLASVAGYSVVFRNGAAVHDYWTYGGIALVGAAVAGCVHLVVATDRLPGTFGVRAAVVVVLLGPLAVVGYSHESAAEERIRAGLAVIPVLGVVPEPVEPTQSPVAVYGDSGEVPWADHLVHGRAVEANDIDDLRALPPDLPVLVILPAPPSPRLRAIWTTGNDRFALLPAAALIAHLGG